jgi:hypothetical protein
MLKEYCEKFNLDYDEVMKYKNAHQELTDTEVILHFKPDLHINILGKIIEC